MGVTNPSRCESCNASPAPVRYTEIDAGKVTKRTLCRACAEKRGLLDTGPKSVVVLQQLLSSPNPPARRTSARETGTGLVCTGCGMSLAEFRAQGRLGCARCYTTFQAALGPLLRKLHGAARHVGRTPRSDGRITELRRRVETLRAEIERAVRGEEYERAARLRDELRAVEAEQSVVARGGPEAAPGSEDVS
jgi:protein arginine kinase activator